MPEQVWTDERLLMAMHMADNQGISRSKIAAHFTELLGRRLSKGSVCGVIDRVHRDEQPGAEHMDGTMPPLWWRRGEADL